MASTIRSGSNVAREKELSLLKRIKIEQTFANQVYANFQSIRFGIEACCFTDFEQAVLRKDICDWQNSASTKVVVATEIEGVFVEPLAKVNAKASISCPDTPTNVCTILDLADIIADSGTYTQCFEVATVKWTITHNLGKFPSVTVVDLDNNVVIGDVDYLSTNIIQITFSIPFSGCAFLN
jgi:hypothetical protein|tara:strand:+ start:1113 stop:1655 length:543 start_codon:yes stop_codon:yes gene_type:complete